MAHPFVSMVDRSDAVLSGGTRDIGPCGHSEMLIASTGQFSSAASQQPV